MGAKEWARLAGNLARREQTVEAAGFGFALECLDDLDEVIDELMQRAPARKGATSVFDVCPHFGVVWPSALALCAHLREKFEGRLARKTVLELGCGLALPAMVAARLGAAKVIATDRHPLVPLFLARNAQRNGLAGLAYAALDWRQDEAPAGAPFDLVVGSDLLYEPWQPGYLAHLLPRVLAPGGEAIVADPGRRYVDEFVTLVEAAGLACDLGAVKRVSHGGATVEVLIIEARRQE